MTRAVALLLPLLLGACVLFGDDAGGGAERVEEAQILELVSRMETFYGALAQRSVDSVDTFEDTDLRSYFLSEREFTDYYASLATQVREAHFRGASPDRVSVRHFRFEDGQTAVVSLLLVGQHYRGLRFWELGVERVDTWRFTSQGWVVSPDRL